MSLAWRSRIARAMAQLVLHLSWLLYIALPIWMFARDWPFRAGLAMTVATLLPWAVWYATVPRPWGPGAGIVLMISLVQLLLAVPPLVVGGIAAMFRCGRRLRSRFPPKADVAM